MLVIATNDTPVYKFFRKIYQAYMNSNPDIKVFFVYGAGADIDKQEYDLVYDDIIEKYDPSMILKSLRAMAYINDNYNYDYFIRTNLTTVWDFDRLLSRLTTLPLENCLAGTTRKCRYRDIVSPDYISGIDLIVNQPMISSIVDHSESIVNWNLPEDWAMFKYFSEVYKAPLHRAPRPTAHIMENFTEADPIKILKDIELARSLNKDHFRIKNNADRDTIDPFIAKMLCQQIYNITVD